MAEHAQRGPPGAMTVITHRPEQQTQLKEFLGEHMDREAASIAAINGPTQLVISGCLREIGRLERILSADARLSISSIARLPRVSCAFHSPLMAAASEAFYVAAQPILRQVRPPRYPLINNVFADRMDSAALVSSLASLLREQIVRPVLWHASLQKILAAYHPSGLLPLGPGTMLASLLRRDPRMVPLLLANECDQ